MRLSSIPGLMSICILLTHSSRFVLATESPKPSNQTSQSQSETPKPPDRSQSSHSASNPSGFAHLSSSKGSGDQDQQAEKELKAVGLDFKNNKDCDQYSYSLDKNTKTGTFVPKSGFVFNLVKHDEINIWDTQDKTQYSNKVIVLGIGSDRMDVTIYLLNGNTKSYRRRNKGYQWLDVTVCDDNEKIPMELNFSEEKSDEEFEYVKGNDGTASYIAKDNFVFDRVFKPKSSCCCDSDAEIWVVKDKLYSNKVVKDGIDTFKCLNNVSVYLTDGTVKSFNKKDKIWLERSNLIELDVSKTSSAYEFDFQKDDKTKTNIYLSKHGFKFSTVKHKEVQVWKSTDPKEYPYKVKLQDLSDNKVDLTIYIKKSRAKKFNRPGKDNPWSEVPTTETDDEEQVEHPSYLKIFTDLSDGNTKENDSTQYDLKKYDKFYKFEFKDDAKFVKLISEEQTVWTFPKGQEKYPKEMYHNTSTKISLITLYRSKYVYNYGDDWKTESGTTDKKLANSKFKIVTEGSTVENDNTKYDETNDGSFVKCQFKDNAKCTELKYDKASAWKYDQSQHCTNHPKCLYFHKHMKVVFVEFEDKFHFYRLDENKWEFEDLKKNGYLRSR